MNNYLSHLPDEIKKNIPEEKQPEWVDPMLATLTDERFSNENWIFERKLDGERCLTYCQDGQIRLMSRNKKKINHQYPELVEAFENQESKNFIVDGEIVAFDGNISSFSKLQKRMHVENPKEALRSDVKVFYYLFDIIYVGANRIDHIALRHRKSVLKKAIQFSDPLRFTIHRNQEGENYFKEACRKGWEGIIAKDANSSYVHSRSNKWLKFKCVNQQEFVIGGFTEPEGERIRFGALLLGYYQNGNLQFAGKVGTGFDEETLNRLGDKLNKIEQSENPFEHKDFVESDMHWTKPQLVAEIGFEEWTQHDKLRQPRYLGLRDDKSPDDVFREKS